MRRILNTMGMCRLIAAAAVGIAGLGACSSPEVTSGRPVTQQEIDSARPPAGASETATPQRQAQQPAAAAASPNGRPTPVYADRAAPGSAPVASGQQKPGATTDEFAQRMHVPAGWKMIMYGQVDPYYWRVYAGPNEQDRDGACFGMWDAGPRGGGGGSACGSSPFFTSGSETPHMVYGIVTSAAATVSVEHAGAPPESLPALSG
jgi:hypothetical protein